MCRFSKITPSCSLKTCQSKCWDRRQLTAFWRVGPLCRFDILQQKRERAVKRFGASLFWWKDRFAWRRFHGNLSSFSALSFFRSFQKSKVTSELWRTQSLEFQKLVMLVVIFPPWLEFYLFSDKFWEIGKQSIPIIRCFSFTPCSPIGLTCLNVIFFPST